MKLRKCDVIQKCDKTQQTNETNCLKFKMTENQVNSETGSSHCDHAEKETDKSVHVFSFDIFPLDEVCLLF